VTLGCSAALGVLAYMSILTYYALVSARDKPLVWLHGELKTPPLSGEARIETGFLLRRLQRGESLGMPHSRPMPGIGARCHELRVTDTNATWRVIYRIDEDAIVLLEIFSKKAQSTPQYVIKACKARIKDYDNG